MSTQGGRPRPDRPTTQGVPDTEYYPPDGSDWRARYRTDQSVPEWRAWTWTSTGRRTPLLGILLVVVGIGLVLELFIPELSILSLAILAAGAAFGFAWLARGIVGATVPALVLCAWALARLGAELGLLAGEGWTLLFVGLAFLAGWGLGRVQEAPRQWALWVGGVLALIGLADASDALHLGFDLGIVVPLVLIGVGVYLIAGRRLDAG
jgi:hypothetical protein